MAIVGTAYVEVKAVTDKVRQEVRSGFQRGMSGVGDEAGQEFDKEMSAEASKTGDKVGADLKKKMGKAGEESGQSFMDRFKAKVQSGGGGIGNRIKGIFGQAGDDSGNEFGRKFWNKADQHFSKVSLKTKLLAGLTSFIGPAVSLVGSLGGGLVALASSATSAAGAMPILYSTLVPVMGAIKGMSLATNGLQKALKQVMAPGATMHDVANATKGMVPAEAQFVRYLHTLSPALQHLRAVAARNLFPGLTDGIKGAMPLLPAFQRMIGSTNRSIGSLAAGVGHMLGGPLRGEMQDIFSRNARVVGNLTGALQPMVDVLVRVYHAIQPVQEQMSLAVKHGAEWLDNVVKVNEANGHLAQTFQNSWSRAKVLGDILRNLAVVVHNVFKAASGAGDTMFKSLDAVTKRWANFTNQVSTQNAMRDWFNNTVPVMKEFMGIIGDLLKGIVHLGSSKDLLPLLHQIRDQLVPALLHLLQATTGPVAASMVRLLSDLADTIAKISGSGSTGFLNSFINTLDAMVKVVNTLLAIPGFGKIATTLGAIAGSMAAFGFVAGKLKMFKMAGEMLGFGKAAKTTAGAVDALKLSKMSEAEKLAANEVAAGKNAKAYGRMGTAVEALKGKIKSLGGILGRGGGAAAGAESGVEGAAAGGAASKIGGMLKKALPWGAAGGAAAEGGAAEGGIIAAIFGTEASIPVVGWIAAGITAIGVAAFEAYKHIKPFHDAVNWVGSQIGDAFKATGREMMRLPGQIGHVFSAIPGALRTASGAVGRELSALPHQIAYGLGFLAGTVARKAVDGFKWLRLKAVEWGTSAVNFVAGLPGKVSRGLSSLGGRVKTIATNTWHGFQTQTRTIGQNTLNWIKLLPGRVRNFFTGLPGNMRRIGTNTMNGMRSGASSAWGGVRSFFSALPGRIRGFFSGAGSVLLSAGRDLIGGLWNGIKSAWDSVKGGIGSIWDSVKGGFNSAFNRNSPSKWFATGGDDLIKGAALGMERSLVHVDAAMLKMRDRMARGLTGADVNAAVQQHLAALTSTTPSVGAAVLGTMAGMGQPRGGDGTMFGGVNGAPLLYVEHLHVRDDSDIDKIGQLLYKAQDNQTRAAGKRKVQVSA